MKSRNAADVAQINEASKKDKAIRDTELSDIRFVLSSRGGRRFYWRYLEECGIFRTSFTGTNQTYFLEGQRNIGLKLLSDLNEADPRAYFAMLDEHSKDEIL